MTAPSGTPRQRTLGVVALGCVALQFPGTLELSLAALGLWLLALAALDRTLLPRLWHPRFIAVSAAVALLSGLLLGRRDVTLLGVGLSTKGLLAGALMMTRGLLIFGLTVWGAAVLSRSPWFRARGALGAATAAALDLIPALTDRVRATWAAEAARGRWRWAAARAVTADLLFHAASIAEEMSTATAPPRGES
ncbi:MAG: hypothetical protein MUC69_00590 [Gemmatimonadales bacterium]|jgi:hypothetical protein|nr:hypothetical protein [Gemmatimonadales bacterium]